MADPKRKVPQSIEGEFFVDDTCIDCGTCRELAPDTFHDAPTSAFVGSQPLNAEARRRAFHALLACPSGSIGSASPREALTALPDFPLPIEGDVSFCGFNSPNSYGATSYFVRRPEGNWLIDSPRYVSHLVERFEAMGGVRYIFLTHRDDVADAHRYAERFGSERIIHEADADGQPGAEVLVKGLEPLPMAGDFTVLPVPGHTAGHSVLLYKGRYLFSGDHLAWDRYQEQLRAFRWACWYSWPEQIESMKRLSNYGFEWVLPGHGYRVHLPEAQMREHMAGLIARMPSQRR